MELNGKLTKNNTLSGSIIRSSGGGGTSDYEQLSNLPQINSVELVGDKSTSDLGLDQVFWATYNSTTSAQIEAAYQAGKVVMLKYMSVTYKLTYRSSATLHIFTGVYNKKIYTVNCNSNSWSSFDTAMAGTSDVHNIPAGGSSGQVLKKSSGTDYAVEWANESGGGSSPDPYTSNPAALGTASPGSSSDYSRGDHVHAMPSASDVGAEPAVTEVTNTSTGAVSLALDVGKIYHFTGAVTGLTITLNAAASGQLAHYHFDFDSGSTAATLTLPQTVVMPDSFAVEASKHYEIDILNNYGTVMAWATS